MKMFKKLMAVVLTGALAVSMLAGCSLTDNLKKDNALKALGEVATARLDKDDTVKKVTFKEDSKMSSSLAKMLKGSDNKALTAEQVEALAGLTTDKKQIVSVVEVKSNTTSVSNFKDKAPDLLDGMVVEDGEDVYAVVGEVKNTTETVKVGIKVQSFKNAEKKTVYYAIILVDAEKVEAEV